MPAADLCVCAGGACVCMDTMPMQGLLAFSDTHGCSLPHIRLQGLFVFSLIWCVGATVDDAGRAKFDAFLRALLKREAPGAEGALAVLAVPGAPQPMAPDPKELKFARPLPEKGTVFDVVWTGRDWQEWMGTQPHYQVREGATCHPMRVACACMHACVCACVLCMHACVGVPAGARRAPTLIYARCPRVPSSTTSS